MRENIECDFVRTEAYDVFFRDEDWTVALNKVKVLREAGVQSAIDLKVSSSAEEAERVSIVLAFKAVGMFADRTRLPAPKVQKDAFRTPRVTWHHTCW